MLSVLQNWDNGCVWGIGRHRVWGDRVVVVLLTTAMVLLVAAVAVGAGAFNH
jgi:hypothetical protein